ncbi:unnamed protein product [Jaminaea pallidilutea]
MRDVSNATWLAAIAAALLLLPQLAAAALFPAGSPVVQLTSSSFKRQILDIEKPTLVAFTAPWCGHCKNLAPEFDRAARSLDGIVKFANIDCDADSNKQTCARYGIQGFPTIKLFPATTKRLPRDYRGERAAKAMVAYAVDSLPHSVKKLNAEDLQQFVVRDPSKPKVLLFSDKATSSPLYKSLALDFRKSMSFAFARGDQAPVQNSARVSLGINIQGTSSLPTLVIFPPRASEEFEKGTFETYAGKLKYQPLKAWIDGVKEKYNVKDQVDPAKEDDSAKAKAKAKSKNKAKSKSSSSKQSNTSGTDSSDEPLPEGAAYEWKPPPSKQQKKQAQSDDPMLSRDRASQLAEEIREQQEAIGKKPKGQAGDAEGLAFGEGRKPDGSPGRPRKQATKEAPSADDASDASESAPEPEEERVVGPSDPGFDPKQPYADSRWYEDHVNEGAYVYTDSQQADVHAINQILEESGAYAAVDETLNRVGAAAKGAGESAADTLRRAKDSVAAKLGSAGTAHDEADEQDIERQPFIAKRRALLKTFERWLTGEHPEWKEMYGKDFARATKDVEDLVKSDPARAEELAWENEEWMLKELLADRDKMADVIGEKKRENLEEMITMIQGRLKKRQEETAARHEGYGFDAAIEAAKRAEEKLRIKSEDSGKSKGSESASQHDEL